MDRERLPAAYLCVDIGLLLLAVTVVNAVFFGGVLCAYGLRPRSVPGLWGSLAAPFLHGSWQHLISNLIGLATLGWMALAAADRWRRGMTFWSWLGSSATAWCLGAEGSVHVGFSGILFGWAGFLFTYGIFRRRWWSMLVSLLAILVFGGMLMGLRPDPKHQISWQMHAGGLAGGILAAWRIRKE